MRRFAFSVATTLGLIADTHIPDRVRSLAPQVLRVFRAAGVEAILHAGDVSTPAALADLGAIAPVHAVRGNRDWAFLNPLPARLSLTFEQVNIGIAHGHGGWVQYLTDKPKYWLYGFDLKRLAPRLVAEFPQAQVILFGHVHRPVIARLDGKLLVNPGSSCCPDRPGIKPSVGLLHIDGATVDTEIVTL